ncbi:hypothetical protein [Streptomyces sp. NPDC058254]|uniref:hypothetical protein n=1 Tax=Streptomyces sp. NPDC058254 TaxID=3346406 RepID=UPI0036E40EB6
MSADESEFLAAEWEAMSTRWEALRERVENGDGSELDRQRMRRLEAYMSALAGDPAALSR